MELNRSLVGHDSIQAILSGLVFLSYKYLWQISWNIQIIRITFYLIKPEKIFPITFNNTKQYSVLKSDTVLNVVFRNWKLYLLSSHEEFRLFIFNAIHLNVWNSYLKRLQYRKCRILCKHMSCIHPSRNRKFVRPSASLWVYSFFFLINNRNIWELNKINHNYCEILSLRWRTNG